jgi:hypothetical protein
MNQRGEVTLFAVAAMAVLTALMVLCSLGLAHSYGLLKKRTQIFLCAKETKGELHQYLKLMGRSNWALKNLKIAKLAMLFIPGLQAASLSAEKTRKLIIVYQNLQLAIYLKRLAKITRQGCKFDPRMFTTPFHLSLEGYARNPDGSAKMRSEKWTYYFINVPYVLTLKVDAQELEKLEPKINYQAQDSGGIPSFLFSSVY